MVTSLDEETPAQTSTSRQTEVASELTRETVSSDRLATVEPKDEEATGGRDPQETPETTEGRGGEERRGLLVDERTFLRFGMQTTRRMSEETPFDCDRNSVLDPGEVSPRQLSSGGSRRSVLSRVLPGCREFEECDDDVCSWPHSASPAATGFLVQMRQPRSNTCDSCRSVVSDSPGVSPE